MRYRTVTSWTENKRKCYFTFSSSVVHASSFLSELERDLLFSKNAVCGIAINLCCFSRALVFSTYSKHEHLCNFLSENWISFVMFHGFSGRKPCWRRTVRDCRGARHCSKSGSSDRQRPVCSIFHTTRSEAARRTDHIQRRTMQMFVSF